MDQIAWIIWVVLGVILVVAEIFTMGFFLLWFGIGAFAAALVGIAGGGLLLQFLAFAGVSILMTAMSRTILAKYFAHGEGDRIKYGVDSMPGQIGTVTIGSKGSLNEGAVKAYGSTWTAFPVEGEAGLVEGEKVEVVEVRGSSIYVKKIGDGTKTLPDWRDDK
jgi:membrane protein implicated in regulation of membrane protease activity